jgi:drug/metabolite transporter (DMT)-like permease
VKNTRVRAAESAPRPRLDANPRAGKPRPGALDAGAVMLMLVLCALWGFNHVSAKLAAPGMSFVLQSAVRFAIAAILLTAWASLRGVRLVSRDGTALPGLLVGLMFAGEFLCIAAGLNYTTAARMTVLVNLAPCWTVLGLALCVRHERLNLAQSSGMALGVLGTAIAFGEAFGAGAGGTLPGDILAVLGGMLWGLTTVVVRISPLARANPVRTLWYQLAIAAPLLWAASHALHEPGLIAWSPRLVLNLLFQGVIIAFISYLLWFQLLTRYLASRLAAFTFITPIFGVLAAVLVLGEPATLALVSGAAAIALGLFLINRRPAR